MLGDDALVMSHRIAEWTQQRARPRGRHRAVQHRARPARPGAAAAGPRGRGRRVRRAGAARGLAGPARGRAGVLPRGPRVPQRAPRRGRQRRLRRGDRAGAAASRSGASPSVERLRDEPRPRAGRRRRQGRQGAGLPPRLRRALVRHAGPGHRRVPHAGCSPALDALWPLWPELFDTHPVEAAAAAAGVGVDPATVRDAAEAVLDQVLAAADVERPEAPRRSGVLGQHRPRRHARRGAEPDARRDAGPWPAPTRRGSGEAS